MSERKRWWIGGVAFVLLVASLVLHGDVCETAPYQRYEDCASYSLAYVLGHWLDTHNGLVTAFATAFIGAVVYLQLRVLDSQKRAMHRQAAWMRSSDARLGQQLQLMNLEFVATHRPRLAVRNIGYDHAKNQVDFIVANVGSSDAIIIEAHAELWAPGKTPRGPRPPFSNRTIGWLKDKTIRDGEEENCALGAVRIEHPDRTIGLYFIGYIKYADAGEGEDAGLYRMAFCREYRWHGQRFVLEENPDPDYEYQS